MQKIKFILFICVLFVTQLLWAGGEGGNALVGDPVRGKELYDSDLGCNVCHGLYGEGAVGPNVRKIITTQLLYSAVQNFPDMINWQYNNPELFEEQALIDIVAFLQTLPRELPNQ